MAQQELSNGNILSSNYQKSEPFLWFHIALLAAVPFLLIVGMLGLGVGNPVLPEWLEITVLGLPPIALPVILQWWKPLSPFSLWLFAKPLELTDDNERRILTVVKEFKTVLVAIALGFLVDAIFCKIYAAAPLVENVLPLPDGLRILGIIWWLAFFLISNLLIQAGAVVIRVLLSSEADLNKLTPLPVENINSTFTSLGKRSPQLLYLISDSHIQEAILEPKPKDQPQSPKATSAVQTKVPEITQPDPVPETIPAEPIVEPTSDPNEIAPEVAIDKLKDIEPTVPEEEKAPEGSPQLEVTNLAETTPPITPEVEAPQSSSIDENITEPVPVQSPIPTPPEPFVPNLEVSSVPSVSVNEPESSTPAPEQVNQEDITEQVLIRTKEIFSKEKLPEQLPEVSPEALANELPQVIVEETTATTTETINTPSIEPELTTTNPPSETSKPETNAS